jgi:photosystem II stability/assembly factor-like uncharacterized protein
MQGMGGGMALCLSHGGKTIVTAERPTTHILIGTIDGVVELSRRTPDAPWEESGRCLQGTHVNAILVEPSTGATFVGTQGQGLYVSRDDRRTWARSDSGIPHEKIATISHVEANGQIRLYAGTEPAHLYLSTDVGQSWTEVPTIREVPNVDGWFFGGSKDRAHVKHVNYDPLDPNTIYACIEVGSVCKSTDGGHTWRVLTGFYEDVHRLLIPPSQPRHLWIATGEGLYDSPDAGESWNSPGRSLEGIMYPDGLLIDPYRESVMFATGATVNPRFWPKTRYTEAKILRSTDSGATWTEQKQGLPDPILGNVEALAMEAWPAGACVAAGTTKGEIYISDDQGDSWTTLTGFPAVSKDSHAATLARTEIDADSASSMARSLAALRNAQSQGAAS